MVGYTTIISVLLLFGTLGEASKILVLFTIPVKSHVGAYRPLAEELVRRGHEVTVVTAFSRGKPLANYTEIIFEDTFPRRDSTDMNLFEFRKVNFMVLLIFMQKIFSESCEKLIKQPIIQQFIHSSNLDYDLVIYEPLGSECIYGLLYKIGAPSIQIIPNTIPPWLDDSMGNPSTLSYIPDIPVDTESRDFSARFFSVLRSICMKLVKHLFILPRMNSLMREQFPDISLPMVSEIEANASLAFVHSNPILNYPRPLTPNTIEVGGLHIKDSERLPQDLQTFFDDAPHGVIYFSLGSNVRSVDMPDTMLHGILKSFSKLKEKVLWKWEADSLPGQPTNVRLGKWLPQHAILAHPKVKLFITHGGLMSIQEATYFGVPVIAIPVMGDQTLNAIHAQSNGYAVVLEVTNITEKSLDWAVHEILHEPRYRQRAQYLSQVFRDQPQKPLERAVYWVEYAIRHKGAPHMRSAALDLNFFQYYLLDVIAVLSLVACASVILTLLLTRALLRRLFSKPAPVSKNKKKN